MNATDHKQFAAAPSAPVYLTQSERDLATVAHAGSFVAAWLALGALAPLLVLLLKGRESAYVRHHALESLQFQLNMLFWIAVSCVLMLVLVGFVMIAFVGVWYAVLVIYASVQARRGTWFRYPAIIRFVD